MPVAAGRGGDSAQAPGRLNLPVVAPANPYQAIHQPPPHCLYVQSCLPAPRGPLLTVKKMLPKSAHKAVPEDKQLIALQTRQRSRSLPAVTKHRQERSAEEETRQVGFHEGLCSEHAYGPTESSLGVWKLFLQGSDSTPCDL